MGRTYEKRPRSGLQLLLGSSLLGAVADCPGWYVLVLMIMQDIAIMSDALNPGRELWPVSFTQSFVEEVCPAIKALVSMA